MSSPKKERELLKWCIAQVFEGNNIDGDDFQDKAEALGVLVAIKIPQKEIDANPEKYSACLECGTDELYYAYWSEEVTSKKKKAR